IGQSHLDIAWLWTLEDTDRKTAQTFSTALRLMEEYPEFRFTQSQAALYELAKTKFPELFNQIRVRVAEGRWIPVGSMWVEPDCNLPSGESLVRQILLGRKFFLKHFGLHSTIAWLPDSFGYAGSLPQILLKAGFQHFFTTKLTWNDSTIFPHSSFWWEGIDGSRLLAANPPVGLEGTIDAKHISQSSSDLVQDDVQIPGIQTFGFGDGGGGVSKEQLETHRILRSVAGVPPSIQSTPAEFFAELALQGSSLPVWRGELYLERCRGTYTTHGWMKKLHRHAETALYNAEYLATRAMLASNVPGSYPSATLEQAWKRLLMNQFHDLLPGTAIEDAYVNSREDFAQLFQTTSKISDATFKTLSSQVKRSAQEQSFMVINTLGWTRSEYVELVANLSAKHVGVFNQDGSQIPFQVIERGKRDTTLLCFIDQIPPFGTTQIVIRSLESTSHQETPWKISSHTLETPFYRTRWDNKGSISSLHSKPLRRELIQKSKRGNLFQTFSDAPAEWQTWDIDKDFERHRVELLEFKGMKVVENGPLRLTMKTEFKTSSGSTIVQHIRFYHKSAKIDFDTTVVWKERQVLLKAGFWLNVKTGVASYEVPFGFVQRSTKMKDEASQAKFEVPAQQWAALTEQKFGVALLNDCKYGYDCRGSFLRLTLLRSPYYPHPIDPKSSHDTTVTDQGEHTFRYSIVPFAGSLRQGMVVQGARNLNTPPFVVADAIASPTEHFVTTTKPNIVIDAVKKAEDSDNVVIRLHEAYGESAHAGITLPPRTAAAVETNLIESDPKPLKISKGKITLKFKPFEIKTLNLSFLPPKKSKR
ncbi:MAG: alpha-mannosidase, partial [Ignavibacteriales bacterium]|nr:alpha-mannosidase [Ignavibacteriales bacterium]